MSREGEYRGKKGGGDGGMGKQGMSKRQIAKNGGLHFMFVNFVIILWRDFKNPRMRCK